MYRILLLAVTAAALAVPAATASAAGDVDGVWVDGVVHDLVVTGPATAGARAIPLFVIAPVSAARPLHPLADARTHGFGAHDHVIALAAGATTFAGACDLTLVVPGPKGRPGSTVAVRMTTTPAGPRPLLYAAKLGRSLQPLTSAGRIVAAQHRGLARLVDTHTLVACSVKPRAGG